MLWAVILFFILMILVFICALLFEEMSETDDKPVAQAMFTSLFSGSIILIIIVSIMFIGCLYCLIGGAVE